MMDRPQPFGERGLVCFQGDIPDQSHPAAGGSLLGPNVCDNVTVVPSSVEHRLLR